MGEDRRLHYSGRTAECQLSSVGRSSCSSSSLANNWPMPGVAALMTGMGRDGAAGLLKLRGCNWRTIAQD